MSESNAVLTGVTKRYGAECALADLDFVLRAGERVGLVGHNGAGKSTLIKLMLGLVRPSCGRVEVLGEDPGRGPSTRARMAIGYLPENVVFPASMTGQDMLAFYARLKRRTAAECGELLQRVGIAHAAKRRIGTYSKGMRQRLGLAQALLGNPRILLLDEPTTGLDPVLRHSFYQIIAEMSASGVSIVLSSHALSEIEGEVDRLVLMSHGRKVADATLGELRRIARGPVRIKVRLAEGAPMIAPSLPTGLECTRVAERTFEVRCGAAEKMLALRELANGAAAIEDVEIVEPGLDAIYAHFVAQQAAE